MPMTVKEIEKNYLSRHFKLIMPTRRNLIIARSRCVVLFQHWFTLWLECQILCKLIDKIRERWPSVPIFPRRSRCFDPLSRFFLTGQSGRFFVPTLKNVSPHRWIFRLASKQVSKLFIFELLYLFKEFFTPLPSRLLYWEIWLEISWWRIEIRNNRVIWYSRDLRKTRELLESMLLCLLLLSFRG